MYLSLHGMGGAGAGKPLEDGAFPWHDKPFMLQVQARWSPGSKTEEVEEEVEKALCNWVVGFRLALERGRHCGGAFINLPDRTQGTAQYYGGNWPELRRVKGLVDPEYRLRFDMGIDPA